MGSTQFGGITRSGSSGSYSYAVKSGFENKPVNYVSFWDATRFANWLNNGQSGASTETGSYTLGGVTAPVNSTVARNAGANWVVASDNEWVKAAYYDPTETGGAGGYWQYPTQSDTLGDNTAFGATNGANYFDGNYANGGSSGPGTTDVGAYANANSYYGTFDQGGNLWEWNEEMSGAYRAQRGGDWGSIDRNELTASFRAGDVAHFENALIGFRLVSLAPIPEPSAYGAMIGTLALGVAILRRRESSNPRSL